MSDYYIDELQDYFEVLAQDNKHLNHNMLDTADQRPFRSFARFESHEHITQIVEKGGDCILVVIDMFGQRILHQDDDRIRNSVILRFGCKKETNTGDETAAINEAVKKAMSVMLQYLIRVERDAADMCEELRDLEPEQATWDRIEEQPWLTDYYGWDLTIPYRGFMPEYNPTHWRSDNTELPAQPTTPGNNASEGKYQKLIGFKVGEPDAPMIEGSTVFTHAKLAKKYVQVFVANGIKIPEYTAGMTVERYITKIFGQDYLTIVGGVTHGEVIEIYTYEVETA